VLCCGYFLADDFVGERPAVPEAIHRLCFSQGEWRRPWSLTFAFGGKHPLDCSSAARYLLNQDTGSDHKGALVCKALKCGVRGCGLPRRFSGGFTAVVVDALSSRFSAVACCGFPRGLHGGAGGDVGDDHE
jgi:hypothetical protein